MVEIRWVIEQFQFLLEWTRTLYENNFKNITVLFAFSKS